MIYRKNKNISKTHFAINKAYIIKKQFNNEKEIIVALATTMAVASVFSVFSVFDEDVDCTGWWAAHSAGTEII